MKSFQSFVNALNTLTKQADELMKEIMEFELKDGKTLTVKEDGSVEGFEDGEYETTDGKIVIVTEGKFTGFKEIEQATVTIADVEYEVSQEVADKIKELEETVESLKKEIESLKEEIKVEPVIDPIEQSKNKFSWVNALKK